MKLDIKKLVVCLLSAGLFGASFTIIGCSSSTEPSSAPTITRPGVGSTFQFTLTTSDSTGTVLSDSNYTQTIVGTNETKDGRTDVIASIRSDRSDTTYYSIGDNGDLYVDAREQLASSIGGVVWIKAPFAGDSGATTVVLDSTGDFVGSGVPVHVVATAVTAPGTPKTFTVSGTSYTAQECTVDLTISFSALGMSRAETIHQNIWYSEDLGAIVRRETPSFENVLTGAMSNASVSVLQSFDLK